MVVSSVNEKVLEIALRKIRQLSEKNSDLRQYTQQLNTHRAAFRRLANGVKKTKILGNMNGCASVSCIGDSVIDLLVRRPKLFTFKEACAILAHCDIDKHIDFIKDSIRKYAVVIIGLPQCSIDDLPLAVYFFIEDMFGIQTKLELCVGMVEEHETNTVGVVFDNITTKQQIAKKLGILEGTDIEIDTYFDINWILDACCSDTSF